MQIFVTQSDIAVAEEQRGKEYAANSCPIAQSVRRRFPDATDISVSIDSIAVQTEEGDMLVAAPPPEAITQIKRFDARRPVSPFRFSARFEAWR